MCLVGWRANAVFFFFLQALLDTGIVGADQTVDDVLTECYDMFQHAKYVVMANKPERYNRASNAGRDKAVYPEPAIHSPHRHS